MSTESTPSSAAGQARRRIIALPERQIALPVALIAHEGEERDQLEAQIERARPVVCFPSLAHFDASGRERWAGIIVARSHAWDARLDACVPRRAFIALFKVADEGYGWPDSVKRISAVEDVDAFLTELAAPVLPVDDRRPRATKPRPKRSAFTMSLAGDPESVQPQLTLPSLSVSSSGEVRSQPPATPVSDGSPSASMATTADTPAVKASGKSTRPPALAHATPPRAVREPAKGRPQPAAKQTTSTSRASRQTSAPGLRLTSHNAHEQAVLDAARVLGVSSARAIVNAVEECELS